MTTPSSDPYSEQMVERLLSDEKLGTFLQVTLHLGHYKYAMECLIQVSVPGAIDYAARAFYMGVLYKYLADWFEVAGKEGKDALQRALTKLGLADALGPIEALLDSKVGETNWRRAVRDYRNRQGVHKPFKGDVQVRLARKHNIDVSAFQERQIEFFNTMYDHMTALQQRVELAFEREYPDLYRSFRRNGPFLSGFSTPPWQAGR